MIAVCAHESRAVRAFTLARSVGAPVSLDDGRGSNTNHDMAWRIAQAIGSDWSIVLEDDAVPVSDFKRLSAQALACVPSHGVVSFYFGTGYPTHVQTKYRAAIRQADKAEAGWIRGSALYHGVAVAIRTDQVADMLNFVDGIDRPYDERLSAWMSARGLPCWYTFPSLVDHDDSDHVLPATRHQPRDKARRAWRTGAPLNKARFVHM